MSTKNIVKSKLLKNSNAITLISLVIAISILIILTAVTVSIVKDDEIVDYTQNSQNQFEELQTTENSQFTNYKDSLKSEFQR